MYIKNIFINIYIYNRINLLNIYENNGTYLFSNLWIDFI
jgi:hypothetical protein